jgi:hypothetical protein
MDVLDSHNGESLQVAELAEQCAVQLVPFRLSAAKPE